VESGLSSRRVTAVDDYGSGHFPGAQRTVETADEAPGRTEDLLNLAAVLRY
jgi:hypothetical protein